MQAIRQFGTALMLAMLSIGLVLGGLSLSLVEYTKPAAPELTDTLLPSPLPLTATSTLPPPVESPTPSVTASSTSTPVPPPSCPIPNNWTPITVQAEDSVESIAARYRTTAEQLRQANCLLTNTVLPGSTIYVPVVPTNTVIVCVPGAVGWVKTYIVQPGDTLFRIATMHYTSTLLLKQVNCRTSDIIHSGELLWVPNVATRTPTFSLPPNADTFTPFPTEPPTETAIPFTTTPVPTNTLPQDTATPIPSDTPLPVPTATLTPFPQ